MSFNEQETRFHLIDPVLRSKGYDDPQRIKLETPAPVEPTGPKGRRRKGLGRTDYLLCVQAAQRPKPLPVAVLEAKKEAEDPLRGMQQAKGYADCKRFDCKLFFRLQWQAKAMRGEFLPAGGIGRRMKYTSCAMITASVITLKPGTYGHFKTGHFGVHPHIW